jgi:hypothetical protein
VALRVGVCSRRLPWVVEQNLAVAAEEVEAAAEKQRPSASAVGAISSTRAPRRRPGVIQPRRCRRPRCSLTSNPLVAGSCFQKKIFGKLADAWAQQIPEQYLLACFNTHTSSLGARSSAAYGRRRDQDERFNQARAQKQEARGTGRHRAFGGMPPRRWSFFSWLG